MNILEQMANLLQAASFESCSAEELASHFNALESHPQASQLFSARLETRFLSISPEHVVATIPIHGKYQPAGRLHGGATLALIEEVASVGSWLHIDLNTQIAVGQEISATHIRPATGGTVRAEATLSYRGRKILVWDVKVYNDQDKEITLSRFTCHIIDRVLESKATNALD